MLDIRFGRYGFYFQLADENEDWKQGVNEPYDLALADFDVRTKMDEKRDDCVDMDMPNFGLRDWMNHMKLWILEWMMEDTRLILFC